MKPLRSRRHLLQPVACLCLVAASIATASAEESAKIVDVQLGLGGEYRLGAWAPVRVHVRGGDTAQAASVVVLAPDNDGIGVATTAPGGRPLALEPQRVAVDRLYARVGKDEAPLEVRLVSDGKTLDRVVVAVGDAASTESIEVNPATSALQPLVVGLGPSVGLKQALPPLWRDSGWGAPGVAEVVKASDLPLDAVGYDSADVVVLTVGAGDWLDGVTASDPRVVALDRWVRDGGRLVLSCGAQGAEALAPDGPLAALAPGRFDRLASLNRGAPIERFATPPDDQDAKPLDLGGGELTVSRLVERRGPVLAYDGASVSELPLVIRAPHGFGEVTFVALDLDHPAVAAWSGRNALLLRLVGEPPKTEAGASNTAWGDDDATSAILSYLDNQLVGVRTPPFLLVVGLVLAYLALIGPGDYFFVKRVLGKMEATWVTFPLIVAATCLAAYLGANWLKGDALRVNRLEVLDVESTSGRARGVVVTHLFSPKADRYDLRLAPAGADGAPVAAEDFRTAWLGLPGWGLGGMQTRSPTRLGWRADYAVDPTPALRRAEGESTVRGVPVQVWSTKSFVSRWTGKADRSIEASLTPDGEGLVTGRITNDVGAPLENCRLVYGDWAWRLGDLADGETADLSTERPIRLSTLLGGSEEERAANFGREVEPTRSIERLVTAMTFVRAAADDRPTLTASPLRLDLSHHVAAGRAVLVGRRVGPAGSQLLRGDEPLAAADAPGRRDWVYLRFVLEVERSETTDPSAGGR